MDIYALIKLFINISDVDENNGPLHVVSKKHTSYVVKKLKYINRNNYKSVLILSVINIGKSGSALICITTQCYVIEQVF